MFVYRYFIERVVRATHPLPTDGVTKRLVFRVIGSMGRDMGCPTASFTKR